MSLSFRPIRPAEIPQLCQLVDTAYSLQVKKLYGNSRRGRWAHYDEAKVRSFFEREAEGVRVGLDDGRLVACCVSRSFGSLGWFHTLGVHPKHQDGGLGKQAVQDAEAYLKGRGVSVIGLMTWPGALKNIGFYQRLGYWGDGLSIFAYRRSHIRLINGTSTLEAVPLSSLKGMSRSAAIAATAELCESMLAGLNYGSWLHWTLKSGMGDALLFGDATDLVGLALAYPLRSGDWLEGKLLLLSPRLQTEGILWALEHVRQWAVAERKGSFGFPVNLIHSPLPQLLQAHDFRFFSDSMLNMIKGSPWPAQGVHLVRFSG